jgi:hypothetical protein
MVTRTYLAAHGTFATKCRALKADEPRREDCHLMIMVSIIIVFIIDRPFGLAVGVPGSIPGTTRFSEK